MSRVVKLLTYNVWFDETFLTSRTHQICRLICDAAPDILCLQEVTPDSYAILLRELTQYEFSPLPEDRSYFAAMLVHRDIRCTFENVRFPSEMGRSLLLSRIQLGDGLEDLLVATSHFESMSSRPLRRVQLQIAGNALRERAGRWILCGDFNFCSYQNFLGRQPNNLENTVLEQVLPPHHDVWPLLHKPLDSEHAADDEWRGYTFNSEKNFNIHQSEQMRYDRVVVSSEASPGGNRIEPVSISLFGTDPVDRDLIVKFPPDTALLLELPNRAKSSDPYTTPPKATVEDLVVFPSDHFGLLCHLLV